MLVRNRNVWALDRSGANSAPVVFEQMQRRELGMRLKIKNILFFVSTNYIENTVKVTKNKMDYFSPT